MNLEQAKLHLEAGGLVAYPTETVWGLGALFDHEKALQQLLQLKGREMAKGVSLLVSDLNMARTIAQLDDPRFCQFLENVWPGPLTAVVPAKGNLSKLIHGGTHQVGMRLSSHPLVSQLVGLVGKPVTTTSANKSGQAPALEPADLTWLPKEVGILEGGGAGEQEPSTVVRLSDQGIEVLRPGAVPIQELIRLGSLCDLPFIQK